MDGELLSRQLSIRKSRPALCVQVGIWSLDFLFFRFSFIKTFLILSILAGEHFLWDRKGEENPLVNIISTEQPVSKDHDKKANRYYVIIHPSFYMSAFQ